MLVNIAHLVLEIKGGLKENYIRTWQQFENNNITHKDCILIVPKCNYVEYSLESIQIEKDFKAAQFYKYNKSFMTVDFKWERAYVFDNGDKASWSIFANQIFYTHAVQRHMIQIHSSMIEYSGNGLLFLGPSGIGKTTMAELWNKYRGALIINGDMNFVQETDECFLGWGTPWHGSSPYCENTSVPVKALIVLKQAPENSIRELKDFEKVQLVSNNIIYPTWLEGGMELCLETLNHLLSAVPVYELSCRPDEEAVRLTEEAVFGGSV